MTRRLVFLATLALGALLSPPDARAQEAPGALWETAATLQQSLSDAEKAEIIASAEALREQAQARRQQRREARPDRGLRGPRMRGRRGGRGMARGLQRGGIMQRGGMGRALQQNPLTSEQREQLRDIAQELRAERRELAQARWNGDLEPEAHQAQMQALREAQRTRAEAILTPAQRSEIEAAREQRRDRRAERHQARFDAMASALDLSASQRARLQEGNEALREDLRARAQALRQSGADRDALRALAQERREARQDLLEDVLTADQLETVQLHRALRIQAAGERLAQRRGVRGMRRGDRFGR